VRLLGRQPRERVNELLNASSLMTISSRYETGPTVGYEALATGVPVVTTPVGEIARIVRESDAGRVVPDRQPRSLTDAMREVLAADDDEMRRRSMQAAAPFAASAVLNPLYEWHRRVRPRG
jgi:glycosyltransferase involved in cell wall biosynthesis